MKIKKKHLLRGFSALFALACLVGAGASMSKNPPLPYTALLGLIFCSGMLALWFGRRADAD